jgi:hypothetical protein
MIDNSTLGLFRQYIAATPGARQSTAGWSRFHSAHTAGAYDAKPSRFLSFREMYHSSIDDRGRIAYDQKQRGSIYDPNTGEECNLLTDADPPVQREVESTDAQPDHGPKGAAPPWGPNDEPKHAEPMEPNPNMGFDPYTERQRRAFGAASHNGKLGIDPDFARRALHEDAALGEIDAAQQGRETGPEQWETSAGRDAEHPDAEQDRELIDQRLIELLQRLKAIARDRVRRRAAKDQPPSFPGRPSAPMGSPNAKLAGDSASFAKMYGSDATRLLPRIPAQTPRVFIHRSRG